MTEKEEVNLEWMKDEKKMRSLTEEQQEKMSQLYVEDFIAKGREFPTIYCENCDRAIEDVFQVRGKKNEETGETLFYCSYACTKGYNIKKRKKK